MVESSKRYLNCLATGTPLSTLAALAGAATIVLLAGCGGSPEASPTPNPRIDQALEKLDRLTAVVRGLEERLESGSTNTFKPTPTPGFAATRIAPAIPLAVPLPSTNPMPTPSPMPTPNPDNSAWVQQRLDAVSQLYDLTDAGVALLKSLDLRQMRGEPGFFGSFGFQKWAGVGEAKPIGVIHELGHSYWGGFPVSEFPQLSWDTPRGKQLSPAMDSYHADILAFMAQPPDDYEVFRQRLRNLPEVSDDNREPLLHNLEADMVYGTGGNLSLVPPILRKYWNQFLKEGPFDSWYGAVAWYQSLNDNDRAAANKYLGFEHLALHSYDALQVPKSPSDLVSTKLETLAQEEKQRLYDLADQFDLLLGEAQEEEKFEFWRNYLKDKVKLYSAHQDYLDSPQLPRATDLAAALEFIAGLSGLSPKEQAQRLSDRLPNQPFLVNFLPALDNRALLELFAIGAPLPQGATLQATASFVERLERFSGEVGDVLAAGRTEPALGAQRLEEFLAGADFELKEDLRLFFELFRDEDPDTANLIVRSLDKDTVRRLMTPVPVQIRFALSPEELLAKLDITAQAGLPEIKRGIGLLIEEPSGNFVIDEPFLDQMHGVIAGRSQHEVRNISEIVLEPAYPLEGFIQLYPLQAVDLLDQDRDATGQRVLNSDPIVAPPARIMYRLIFANPQWAARLLLTLEDKGEEVVVMETLAYFAYDKDRLDRLPRLPISVEQDGRFLAALLLNRGEDWLTGRLEEAFSAYTDKATSNQVSSDFLSQFHDTLVAAATALSDVDIQRRLLGVIQEASQGYPVGR